MGSQSLINMVMAITIAVLGVLMCVLSAQVYEQALTEKIHTQCLIKHENTISHMEVRINLLLLRIEKDENLILETARCLEVISQKIGNPQRIERIPFPPKNLQVH